jgi:hypothetical protein
MIENEINKLAKEIAKKAMASDVPLADMTEALKILATWHAILLKYKQKQDDGDGSPTFEDFTEQLKTVEASPNGSSPKVRGRRGTGLSS